METMGWLIIFIVLIVIELLDHGTYNDLVCRRCTGGASDVSVRIRDAGTGCGIYHRIGSAAGTDETDCGEVF